MAIIKKIVGVLSVTGMTKENLDLFSECNCECREISCIWDLEHVDALVIPSGIVSAQKWYMWDLLIDHIAELILSWSFPIWLMGQSIELFFEKIHLVKNWRILECEEEVYFDFLDSKPYKIKILDTFSYQQPKLWFKFFAKEFDEIAFLSTWEACIYRRQNFFATIFSPEFSQDKRLHEYFVNEIVW